MERKKKRNAKEGQYKDQKREKEKEKKRKRSVRNLIATYTNSPYY